MLIIPDIHGRDFWREPVRQALAAPRSDGEVEPRVVFLGDYFDPYHNEGLTTDNALREFRDIVQLKTEHPADIVLLLGNHDLAYICPEFAGSRKDYDREDEIYSLLVEHLYLFRLVYALLSSDGTRATVISHAGIHPRWMRYETVLRTADAFSQPIDALDTDDIMTLNEASWLRGGGKDAGSLIWADVREFEDYSDPVFQIFGHTQQPHGPIITDHYACLDCRQAFEYNPDEQTLKSFPAE